MNLMRRPNKNPRAEAAWLVSICLGGIILGSLVPLLNTLNGYSISRGYVVLFEALGAGMLVCTFGFYALKK